MITIRPKSSQLTSPASSFIVPFGISSIQHPRQLSGEDSTFFFYDLRIFDSSIHLRHQDTFVQSRLSHFSTSSLIFIDIFIFIFRTAFVCIPWLTFSATNDHHARRGSEIQRAYMGLCWFETSGAECI